MKKRILVTGASGFAGRHIIETFKSKSDHELVGLDSFRHRGDTQRMLEGVKYFCHDLNAPISKRLKLDIGYCDVIINAASESHVDRSIESPVSFVQNNVNLALHMLEYARETKPSRFIQVSTDEVYGPAAVGELHKEWDEIRPSNPYSASKAAQEALAMAYRRTYGVPCIITNTMNMFGEYQDSEKFIPKVIHSLLHGETITIHGIDDYIGTRHYLHAATFAEALLFLINREWKLNFNRFTPRFNIAGLREIDNLTLAETISHIMGIKLKYTIGEGTRPGHDLRYALDGSLLRSLGFKQSDDFDKRIKETVSWYLKNPNWLE